MSFVWEGNSTIIKGRLRYTATSQMDDNYNLFWSFHFITRVIGWKLSPRHSIVQQGHNYPCSDGTCPILKQHVALPSPDKQHGGPSNSANPIQPAQKILSLVTKTRNRDPHVFRHGPTRQTEKKNKIKENKISIHPNKFLINIIWLY
jgi:hypothetical protein